MQWEVLPMGMDTFHTWLIWWQKQRWRATAVPTSPASQTPPEIKVLLHACISCTTSHMFQECENSNWVLYFPFPQPLASKEPSGSMSVLQSESENTFQHYTSRHPEICQWPRKHKLVTSRILSSLREATQHHTACDHCQIDQDITLFL